jgi:hypothetical protein
MERTLRFPGRLPSEQRDTAITRKVAVIPVRQSSLRAGQSRRCSWSSTSHGWYQTTLSGTLKFVFAANTRMSIHNVNHET